MYNATDTERIISNFCALTFAANTQLNYCKDQENEINDATQDILHTCELAPTTLDSINLISLLANLRQQRRDAKDELEVAQELTDWFKKNKNAVDMLSATLGKIRKIINKQEDRVYRIKTNILGNKDALIVKIDENPKYEQLTFDNTWEAF